LIFLSLLFLSETKEKEIEALAKQKQEGQHLLTGQRAPPISGGRDL